MKIYTPPEVAIRVYTAIINQTGTDNPTEIILHNTLKATPTLTRIGTGVYSVSGAIEFPENKTAMFINNPYNGKRQYIYWYTENQLKIEQYNNDDTTPEDGIENLILEIRIYNNE